MALPGLYSGSSTFALVARASFFTVGAVYGNIKIKFLRSKVKSQKKAAAKAAKAEAKAQAQVHH